MTSGLRVPNRELITERLTYTIYLTTFTMMITWSFAIPVGIYSAVRQHSLGTYSHVAPGLKQTAARGFDELLSDTLPVNGSVDKSPLRGKSRGSW